MGFDASFIGEHQTYVPTVERTDETADLMVSLLSAYDFNFKSNLHPLPEQHCRHFILIIQFFFAFL